LPLRLLFLPLWFCLSFPKEICFCRCFSVCHFRRKSAFAIAFLSVISEGNLLLPLLFCLSFPKEICSCRCFSVCHFRRKSAFAVAFLSVISEGNLLLPLLFYLSFPKKICFCRCFSVCHFRRKSAFAVAFLSVISEGNLLLALQRRRSLKIVPRGTIQRMASLWREMLKVASFQQVKFACFIGQMCLVAANGNKT
jgi:hypothetical protein